jgi:hypothetical protein
LPETLGRRLLQVVRARHLGHGVVCVLGETAGEENRQSRYVLEELHGGRSSAHVGHHYVQYHQVRPLQFRQAERLPPVGCTWSRKLIRFSTISFIVRNSARKLPDGFKFLRLLKLAFQGPDFRQIFPGQTGMLPVLK